MIHAIILRKEKDPSYLLSSKIDNIYHMISEFIDLNSEDKSLSKELTLIHDYILNYEI